MTANPQTDEELIAQLVREHDALRAEIVRLRAALEWIESVQCIDACHHVPVMKRKAAEALEHHKEPD